MARRKIPTAIYYHPAARGILVAQEKGNTKHLRERLIRDDPIWNSYRVIYFMAPKLRAKFKRGLIIKFYPDKLLITASSVTWHWLVSKAQG